MLKSSQKKSIELKPVRFHKNWGVTNNAKMIACIKLEESIVTYRLYKVCPPIIGLAQ